MVQNEFGRSARAPCRLHRHVSLAYTSELNMFTVHNSVTNSANLHYANLGNRIDDEEPGLTVGNFITAAEVRQILQPRDTQAIQEVRADLVVMLGRRRTRPKLLCHSQQRLVSIDLSLCSSPYVQKVSSSVHGACTLVCKRPLASCSTSGFSRRTASPPNSLAALLTVIIPLAFLIATGKIIDDE